jgi:sugar lactone lactonase YvrE
VNAELFHSSECILGESPLWYSSRRTCCWVDIEGRRIYEKSEDGSDARIWQLTHRVSFIAEDENGKLILGLHGGIAIFDTTDGSLEWLLPIEKEIPSNRCNDGGCDSKGRLWIGTMDLDLKESYGSLYCIDKTLQPVRKEEHLSIPNGLAWSQDDKRMYLIDSRRQTVSSYQFDKRTGNIRFEKTIIHIPLSMGAPDGMAIDEEGFLWIAHWGGFCIGRWNPSNGKLVQSIPLPVPRVSSCAFVGEHLNHLLITTARQNLTEIELKTYPESGNVFIVKDMDVKGARARKAGIGPRNRKEAEKISSPDK